MKLRGAFFSAEQEGEDRRGSPFAHATSVTEKTVVLEVKEYGQDSTWYSTQRYDMTPFAKAARTVAGLYNHATPYGMGYIHYTPGKMTPECAENMVRQAQSP